jgi:hypothetical protein
MANNYWRGTSNSNSNTATNWSLGVVPTSNDGHVAVWDASSPNCTINATLNCNFADFSAYTGALTMTNNIVLNGNSSLGSAFTTSGTNGLQINVNLTLTTNGRTNPIIIINNNNKVLTIVGDLYIDRYVTSNTASTSSINKTTNEKIFLKTTDGSGGGSIVKGTVESVTFLSGGTLSHYLVVDVPVIIDGAFPSGTQEWKKGASYVSGSGDFPAAIIILTNGYNFGTGSYKFGNLILTGVGTTTLTTNVTCVSLLDINNTTQNSTLNGFSINCGSLRSNLTTGTMTGTTVINLSGLGINISSTGISNTINTLTPLENIFTGATANWGTATNWSRGTVPTATDGYLTRFNASSPNCTVNIAYMAVNAISFSGWTGTLTLSNPLSTYGNITLASGMGISGSSTLNINASGLLTSNGKTWSTPLALYPNAGVIKLSGDWANSGVFSSGSNSNGFTITKTSSEKLILSGGLSVSSTPFTSTAQIQLTGGTWSGSTGIFNGDLDFNGNVTISGTVYKGTGLITRTSGTVTTAGSTIVFNNSAIITVNGITWNNVSFTGTTPITLTLDRDLTVNGTMTINTAHTFVGAYNITVSTLAMSGFGYTLSLPGNLTITTALNATSATSIFHNTINSSSVGVKRRITLNSGATHDLSFINFTDIDASQGKPIWTYKGTISNCNNVLQLNANSFVESQIIAA